MPKRGAFAIAMTALALVLLLNFRTPSEIAAVGGAGQRPGAVGTAGGTTGGATQVGSKTITGPVVSTRWGPVQVEITIDGGRITDVVALQLPSGDRRSSSISSRAEPTLRSQALQAQSASIDGVTGATYTSVAYARSLQAALDTAGI